MKKQQAIVSGISIVGIIIAYILNFFYRNSHLSRGVYKIVAEPLFYMSVSLFVVSLIVYFVREEIFHSWIKFTYYWILISIFLVLIIPGGGGNGAFPSLIDAESISILMSGLYFIISLILVFWGSAKYYWFKK